MDTFCFTCKSTGLIIMAIISSCVCRNDVIVLNCTCNFDCHHTGYKILPSDDIGYFYRQYSEFENNMKCHTGWAVGDEDLSLEVITKNMLLSPVAHKHCDYERINIAMALPVYESYYNIHFTNAECYIVNHLCSNIQLPRNIIPWEIQVDPTCFMNAIARTKDKDHNAYLDAVVSDRHCDIQFLPPKNFYLGVCPNKSERSNFIGIKNTCQEIEQLHRYTKMDRFQDTSSMCKLCAWYFNDTSLCFKPYMETHIVLNGPVEPDSAHNEKVDCIFNECFKVLCKGNGMGKDGNCIQPVKYLSGRILSTQVILLYPVNKSMVEKLLMPILADMPWKYQTEVVVKLRKEKAKCWRVTFEYSVLFYIEYKMVESWTRHLTRVIQQNVTHDGRAHTVYFNDDRKSPCVADGTWEDFSLFQFPLTLLFGYACLSFTFATFIIRLFWQLRMEKLESKGQTNDKFNEQK